MWGVGAYVYQICHSFLCLILCVGQVYTDANDGDNSDTDDDANEPKRTTMKIWKLIITWISCLTSCFVPCPCVTWWDGQVMKRAAPRADSPRASLPLTRLHNGTFARSSFPTGDLVASWIFRKIRVTCSMWILKVLSLNSIRKYKIKL